MRTDERDIQGPDGAFYAFLALPDSLPAPAIVVEQEIFGVNHVMRETCETLASLGFIAICPDLFWRIQPRIELTDKTDKEWAKAFELFQKFDVDKGLEDIKATITSVRGHEACTGKVGAVGYCLGGLLAYLTACRTDVDAAVGYYGVNIQAKLDEAAGIKKPLLLHIAGKDQFVPPDAQASISSGLAGNGHVTIHSYPERDHAFARPGGAHFHADDAALANRRTKEFFETHLKA